MRACSPVRLPRLTSSPYYSIQYTNQTDRQPASQPCRHVSGGTSARLGPGAGGSGGSGGGAGGRRRAAAAVRGAGRGRLVPGLPGAGPRRAAVQRVGVDDPGGPCNWSARHDTISTAPFRSAGERARYGPAGQTLFTADAGLPAREGPRPTVPGYVAPQRQTTAPASSVTVVAMADYLDGLARANAHALTVRPSALEGVHADALWLADAMPVPAPMAATTRGEICHVHRSDGSSHMTLSLADADAAVAKGWGRAPPPQRRLARPAAAQLALARLVRARLRPALRRRAGRLEDARHGLAALRLRRHRRPEGCLMGGRHSLADSLAGTASWEEKGEGRRSDARAISCPSYQ